MSPYSIPFNYEILKVKQTIDPDNNDAYRQYMLPDGKTIVQIDIGETEKVIMNDLVNVYLDSKLLDNPYKIS